MKEMSVSAEKLEEQRREERREEVLRMEAREDQKEARLILLFVAVAAVYFIKNWFLYSKYLHRFMSEERVVCGRGGESGSDRGGSSGLGALVAASTAATVASTLILLEIQ